jgi:hypothetical protein
MDAVLVFRYRSLTVAARNGVAAYRSQLPSRAREQAVTCIRSVISGRYFRARCAAAEDCSLCNESCILVNC